LMMICDIFPSSPGTEGVFKSTVHTMHSAHEAFISWAVEGWMPCVPCVFVMRT